MLTDKQINNYAQLVIKLGVNLQKGQDLVIQSPIECAEIARKLAEQGYAAGARLVSINYNDEKMNRIKYLNSDTEVLTNIPAWVKAQKDSIVDNRAAVISIAADDPNIYSGIDEDKLAKINLATMKAFRKYREASMSNYIRWCVISVPTTNWAKKMLPELTASQAVDKLWELIGKTMRLDDNNPLEAWTQHIATLNRHAKFLNDHNFKELHFASKRGTDLTVGLATNHVWLAAQEKGQDDVYFTANMPTEEIFTAPHKYHVDGVLVNALPLVENGNVIDDFSITFKDGKIIDYSAKVGYNTLKHLIETDEGTLHLGEVALIGKNSPIAKMKTLFFNTLFDENASCHLAIGKAYPTTVQNGNNLTAEQLDALGVNNSFEHCDFMIGTDDFDVVGIDFNGNKVQLFVDGDWVI